MPKHAAFQLPSVPPSIALAVLENALRNGEQSLAERLRVAVAPAGDARLILITTATRLGAKSPPETALYEAYNGHPYNAARDSRVPRDLGEDLVDAATYEPLYDSALRLLALAIADENGARLGAGLSADALVATPIAACLYVLGEESEPSATSLARIEWRATGMAVAALTARSPDRPVNRTIACIGIDPAWGATQDLAMRHHAVYEKDVDLRVPYAWMHGVVLLRPGIVLSAALRDIAGALLLEIGQRTGRDLTPSALAIAWSGKAESTSAVEIIASPLPDVAVIPAAATTAARTIDGTVGSTRAIKISVLELLESANATTQLRELMERNANDIGYRLELRRLPQHAEVGDDLQDVQRQIEELQVRRDVLNGLTAGDWRLLRFPGQHLDALIDYLRRFPLDVMDSAQIGYAFHASTTDPQGVHFILYRLRDVGVEPAYPEAYWRRETGNGTIVHHMDALFAQFATSHGVQSLVFTPPHHVIVPNFRSTQQDIDDYLRQGFGGLLGLDDAFAQLAKGKETPRPIYTFGHSSKGEIRIEILDAAKFQPIGRVVPFLNDNLELSRRIDIKAFVENAADGQWRKEWLAELAAANTDIEAGLERRIEQVDNLLAAQSDQLIVSLTHEIDAIRDRLSTLLELIDDLTGRSAIIEKLVAIAVKEAAEVESAVEVIPARFAELDQTRRRVLEAIVKERSASQVFAGNASKNLNDIRSDIDRIERALRNE